MRLEARDGTSGGVWYQTIWCSLTAEHCPFSVKKHVFNQEPRAESLWNHILYGTFHTLSFAMTMSKLDLHVACSTPFVDHTTSLWFTKELVSNTSNIDEFKRRRPNCHATPDATIEHRKPRTTESRVITKDRSNSCPIPIKVCKSHYVDRKMTWKH